MISLNRDNFAAFSSTSSSVNPSGFDILRLEHFNPARVTCENCLALLKSIRRDLDGAPQCPVCKIPYLTPDADCLRAYFRAKNLYINFEDPLEQCQKLVAIARRVLRYHPDYPPIRGLLETLNQAQHFVHFTSFGLSYQFLGALKLTAQRIPVRGLVSVPPDQDWLLSELKAHHHEAPNLTVKTVCDDSRNWDNLPHQKLVVIDGLLAFSGGANLSHAAWRKAARGYDDVQVITDVEKAIDLHNRLFSPIWAQFSVEASTPLSFRGVEASAKAGLSRSRSQFNLHGVRYGRTHLK